VSPRELLPLYALDALEPDEARTVERAVAADPALAAELAALRDVAGALVAAVPPVTPAADVKARLLASVGGGRFEKFSARMAKLYDVTIERARELLGLVERPASWGPAIPDTRTTAIPFVVLVHFDGGPACATADCGFIRIEPGQSFPLHRHRGEEVVVVLAGTLRDSNGQLHHPGDECVRAAGTEHSLTVVGDEPVILAARAERGIEVLG